MIAVSVIGEEEMMFARWTLAAILAAPALAPGEEILFCHYLVHDVTPAVADDAHLRLCVTFAQGTGSAYDGKKNQVELEVSSDGGKRWVSVATTTMIDKQGRAPQWVAMFDLPGWDDSKRYDYRVHYDANGDGQVDETFPSAAHGVTAAVITANPRDDDEFVVATANCFKQKGADNSKDAALGASFVAGVEVEGVDLLYFAGDQTYAHGQLLNGWRNFGSFFKQAMAITPTVVVTDDHDIGLANLWGSAGRGTQ
ncbi:MAG: hypothetical protein ACYTF0_05320, partial [Planctomycetota bacterium]